MTLVFSGEAIHWRGPAPFVFIPVPPVGVAEIKEVANQVTYGWGCIPAIVTIGQTQYSTSIFPKNGGYLVPVKVAVQRAEGVKVGDLVNIQVEIVASSKSEFGRL